MIEVWLKYDCLGNTALHHAIKDRRIEVAAQLIKNGADVMIENKKGQTPLTITDSEGKYRHLYFRSWGHQWYHIHDIDISYI